MPSVTPLINKQRAQDVLVLVMLNGGLISIVTFSGKQQLKRFFVLINLPQNAPFLDKRQERPPTFNANNFSGTPMFFSIFHCLFHLIRIVS